MRIGRARCRETFVPLSHPPGHAQVDFGEAVGVIGGVRQKLHFFCMDLPQSDACFLKAYPCKKTEAFLDGHVAGFAFFGGVPLSILYDNLKVAVVKTCGDGKRLRTRAFTEVVSHDLFGRPGKGNDKGKVEGLVKYARANFMTPVPEAASFDVLNAMLAECCRALWRAPGGRWCSAARVARGAAGTVREARGPHLLDIAGPQSPQRLLGADGLRVSERRGEGVRRPGGDPVWRRGRGPAQAGPWRGRVHRWPAALPGVDRAEAEHAEPVGDAAGGYGLLRFVISRSAVRSRAPASFQSRPSADRHENYSANYGPFYYRHR